MEAVAIDGEVRMRRFTFSCLSLLLGTSFTPSFATCLEELRAFDRNQLKKVPEPDENVEIPSSALSTEEPTPLRLVVSQEALLEMRAKLKAPSLRTAPAPQIIPAPEATPSSPTQIMDREERTKLLRQKTMALIGAQPKLAPANRTRIKIPPEVIDSACHKAYDILNKTAASLLFLEKGMKQEQENLKSFMLKKQRLDEYLQLVGDPDIQKALSAEGEGFGSWGFVVREKMAALTKIQKAFYAEELEDISLLQRTTEEGITLARSRITELSSQAEGLRTIGKSAQTEAGATILRIEEVLQNKTRLHHEIADTVTMHPPIPETSQESEVSEAQEESNAPEKLNKKTEVLITQWEAGCLEELLDLETQDTPMAQYIADKRSKGYRWFIHYHTGVSLRKEDPSASQNISTTVLNHLSHISQKWGFAPIAQDVSEPLKSPRQMDMSASMTLEMSDLLSSMIILDPASFYAGQGGATSENAAASSVPPDQVADESDQTTWGSWFTYFSQRIGLSYLVGK